MKTGNHEAKELSVIPLFLLRGERPCMRGLDLVRRASFLAGMVLVVVLGLMFASSTLAFALGGGGGGGAASAPAPKITKVVDPVAKPEDETAEVENPVAGPKNDAPTVTEYTIAATVGFAASSPVEMHENRGRLQLQVRISEPFPQSVTLNFVTGGTAVRGADYEIFSTSLTIPANATGASLTLTGIDDDAAEDDETVSLTLTGDLLPAGVTIGARSTYIVTIPANDQIADFDEKTGDEVAVKPEPDDDAGDETGADTEDKTVNRHGEGVIDFPESGDEVVEAIVGFAYSGIRAVINHPRSTILSSTWRGKEFGWSDNDNNSLPIVIVLSNPLPQPLEISLNAGEADARLQDGEGTIDVYYPDHFVFAPGETRKVLWFDLDIVDGAWDEPVEPVQFTLYGDLPDGVEFGARSFALRFEIVFHAPDVEEGGIDETVDLEDIDVSYYDEGKISIINEERINEIRALHYDADNKDTEISIENLGTVDNNIVARIFNAQNSGEISIKNAIQGTVGSDIIGKHHGNGEVSIENHGTVGNDIRAVQFGDGGIEIANYGNVDSSMEAINHGSGAVSVENRGTVGQNITILHRGIGDISIENHGTAGGLVHHYGTGNILIKNYGFFDGITVWHKSDRGIIHFDGNIFDVGLVGKTVRLGAVNFIGHEKDWYSVLGIHGNYEASSDTQLNFHARLGEYDDLTDYWDYGQLSIYGDVTGQSRVSLVVSDEYLSSVASGTNFPGLIDVDGNASADDFVGEQTIGAFRYVLEYGFGDHYHKHVWGFVNRGFSDTAVKTSQIPDKIAENIETPPTTNPDKQTKELGLWGEQHGSHTTIGLDTFATRLMSGDMLVGTSMSKNSSTSSNIGVESQITALTASWERRGFHVGGQIRYAGFTSDVSTDRLSVVQDNEGTGVNASVDMDYHFSLPFGGVDFEIAPQMQLVWSRVNFDAFVGPHGERVSLEDGDLVTGRLGLLWDGEWQGTGGFGQIYGGMNLRGALDGETSVNVSGVSIANERKGLSVDGKLGISYEWDEGYAVHGEVSALRDDADEIRADLGMSVNF